MNQFYLKMIFMFQNSETGIFCCTIEYKKVKSTFKQEKESIHFYQKKKKYIKYEKNRF